MLEIGGRFQVICNIDAARALKIQPMPHSLAAVRAELERERRLGDRREEGGILLPFPDRRRTDRRVAKRDDMPWLDEGLLVELVEVEDVDEWEEPTLVYASSSGG